MVPLRRTIACEGVWTVWPGSSLWTYCREARANYCSYNYLHVTWEQSQPMKESVTYVTPFSMAKTVLTWPDIKYIFRIFSPLRARVFEICHRREQRSLYTLQRNVRGWRCSSPSTQFILCWTYSIFWLQHQSDQIVVLIKPCNCTTIRTLILGTPTPKT